MVDITKDDVLDWYQGLKASHRLEVVCTLLANSLPFELRFLGSVIENLGRKDFHILREAENKANNFHSGLDPSTDIATIAKLLSEGPVLQVNPPIIVGNPFQQTGGLHSLPQTGINDATSRRASPSQRSAELSNKGQEPVGVGTENGLPNKFSSLPSSSSENQKCAKDGDRNQELSNHIDIQNEDEVVPKKDLWIYEGIRRRKCILFLSLMSATNHDSANVYYRLLSEMEDLLDRLDLMEDVVQEEIVLLYTIGSHHPAFTFDQRSFLASILSRLKDGGVKFPKNYDANLPPPSHYNNHVNNSRPQPAPKYPPKATTPNYSSKPTMAFHPQNMAVGQPFFHQQPPYMFYQMLMPNNMPIQATSIMPNLPMQPRPRFAGQGGEFPSLNTLESSLMPGSEEPVEVLTNRPKKISCYNCGSNKHTGPECKELSMEDMTRAQYRLNYGGDTNLGNNFFE